MRYLPTAVLGALTLTLVACATAAPAAPANTAPSGSGAASAAASQTTQSTSTPTAAAPAASPVASPTQAQIVLPPGAQRYAVVPAQSEARYRVREQLANLSFPNDAVGTTKSVDGAIVFDERGAVISSASKLVIDVRSLKSDENRRDNFLRMNALESNRFPTATFVPTAIEGLPWPLPASGTFSFQMVGDLTVHGVTKPTTWQATATVAGQEVSGQAITSFKFADFGMQQPRVAIVLSVEDKIQLEFDFRFSRAA